MLDTLASLPIISFVALPLLSNYTTSLNLLFFYMTWTTLVMSYGSLKVELVGTLLIRLCFFLIPGLAVLGLDVAAPGIAESIKAHGRTALPTRHGNRKLGYIVGWAVLNVVSEIAVLGAVETLFSKVLHIRGALNVAVRLPLPWRIATDLVKGFIVRGILQYYIHWRVLHNSRTPLAKQHQSWQHSVVAPFSVAAAYDHPACHALHHTLPILFPAVFFHFHVLTFHLFLVLVSLEELLTYSGSTVLPSTIFVRGMARRNDLHFLTAGGGNFTPLGALDWAHGTNVGNRDITDDIQDEMEKHDVQGRTGEALNGIGEYAENAGIKLKRNSRKNGKKG